LAEIAGLLLECLELLEAAHGDDNGRLQVLTLDRLDQVGQDGGAAGPLQKLRLVVGGNQDEWHRILVADLPGGIDAVHVGHLDVGNYQIGLYVTALVDQVGAVARGADDFVSEQGEDFAIKLEHARFVVGHRDAQAAIHELLLGKVIRISVPWPKPSATAIWPSWASTIRLAMAIPSPVPWVLVVKKGSNSRCRVSGLMPGPLSRREIRISPWPFLRPSDQRA